jgi:aminopeptidase N
MLSNIENESATAVANQDFRLPKSVVPSHYTLHLSPDLVKFVFDGQVTIDVDILESTDTIKLNAKDWTSPALALHPSGQIAKSSRVK